MSGRQMPRHRRLSTRCSANFVRRLKEPAVMAVRHFVWSLFIHEPNTFPDYLSMTASISHKPRSTILGGRMEKAGTLSMGFLDMLPPALGEASFAARGQQPHAHPP